MTEPPTTETAEPAPGPTPGTADRTPRSWPEELRQLARLAGPIVLVQLGTNGLTFVDVAMLGRHSPDSLPAMAMGSSLAWAVMLFSFGCLLAADPLLSQAIGAKDHAAIPRILGRAMLLAVTLTVPAVLVLLPAPLWLTWLGQPEALIGDAAIYAQLQTIGILPFLFYSLARVFLSAHARLWPQVVTILAGNVLNLALDGWLIFGGLGVPALGATGAAISTVCVRWAMLGALLWFGRDLLLPPLRALADASVRRVAFARAPLFRLLRLGAPVGTQLLLEIGIFSAVALCIGYLDAARAGDGSRLAGHQITMQLISLCYMLPLGTGLAASVRVGWAIGRGDPGAVKRSVVVALAAGACSMLVFMALFLLFPEPLARILGKHESALAVAVVLLPVAGVFQLSDGLQAIAVGCLRGLGDLRTPVLANVIGLWMIGLPIGCVLAFRFDAGPAGLWWGLVVGLTLVAAILLLVLRLRLGERQGRLR